MIATARAICAMPRGLDCRAAEKALVKSGSYR